MWSRSLAIKEQQFGHLQHLFNTSWSQTGRQIQDSRQTRVFNQSSNQNRYNPTRRDRKTELDTFRNNSPAQAGRTSRFKYTRRQRATGETGEADYRSREDRTGHKRTKWSWHERTAASVETADNSWKQWKVQRKNVSFILEKKHKAYKCSQKCEFKKNKWKHKKNSWKCKKHKSRKKNGWNDRKPRWKHNEE